MDDIKQPAPERQHQNAANASGSDEANADVAGVEQTASESVSAQIGAEGAMPPLKRMVLTLAELIEAQLTVSTGPQAVLVPGTDFTEEGVRLLLRELGKRSETPGAPGRFLAWGLLIFLTRQGTGDDRVVAGANLMRLQRLATVLDRIRSQRSAPPTPTPEKNAGDDADDDTAPWPQDDEAIEVIEAPQEMSEAPVDQPAKKPRSKPAHRHRRKQEPAAQDESEA